MPGLPAVVPQTVTQQATRHARRVYVAGLPPANEQSVAAFFNQVMSAIGGATGDGGSQCNGIAFEGAQVKVRMPTDCNASQVAALGPTQPNPNLSPEPLENMLLQAQQQQQMALQKHLFLPTKVRW